MVQLVPNEQKSDCMGNGLTSFKGECLLYCIIDKQGSHHEFYVGHLEGQRCVLYSRAGWSFEVSYSGHKNNECDFLIIPVSLEHRVQVKFNIVTILKLTPFL